MGKPPSLAFEQAAAIPQAGVIAYRAIRSTGKVKRGQRVLINGAGGSAGSFAIQLARLEGAHVTGVDNASKLEFMRSLGADEVIDYEKEDFTRNGKQYDLILDVIGHRSIFESVRALRRDGTYYVVGGSSLVLLQALLLGSWIRHRKARLLIVPQNRQDLVSFTELCVAGSVVPAIDGRYTLSEVPEAMRAVAEGRAKGKVVISVTMEP